MTLKELVQRKFPMKHNCACVAIAVFNIGLHTMVQVNQAGFPNIVSMQGSLLANTAKQSGFK